jgi:hypothetical protein
MKKITCMSLLFFCVLTTSFGQVLNGEKDSISAANRIPVKTENKQTAIGYMVPAVFIGYGLVSLAGNNVIRRLDYTTNNELQEDHPSFALKVDNFTRYAPAAAVYGLDIAGVKARHNFADRSVMLLMSVVIAQASVGGVKSLTHRTRPNGTADNSFPSAHTSFAFMSAEFLYQEYKDKSVWYGVAGYAVATGTGILRLYNNAHWVSDVVMGAGIGILSTKVSYLLYPYLKQKVFHGKAQNMMISPGYQNGHIKFNLVKTF